MKIITLSDDECRKRLALGDVGRLAILIGGFPEVFPVNYMVVRDRVVIRTDPGAKLSHAGFERVCFEIDGLDDCTRTGWSVLVRGVMHEVDVRHRLDREISSAAKALSPWGGQKSHVVVVTPLSMTGREIVPT